MCKDLATPAQPHLTMIVTAAICGVIERVEIEIREKGGSEEETGKMT